MRVRVWLGSAPIPYGDGNTVKAAVDGAIAAYESACGYGQPHEFADREALVAALSVEVLADTARIDDRAVTTQRPMDTSIAVASWDD